MILNRITVCFKTKNLIIEFKAFNEIVQFRRAPSLASPSGYYNLAYHENAVGRGIAKFMLKIERKPVEITEDFNYYYNLTFTDNDSSKSLFLRTTATNTQIPLSNYYEKTY